MVLRMLRKQPSTVLSMLLSVLRHRPPMPTMVLRRLPKQPSTVLSMLRSVPQHRPPQWREISRQLRSKLWEQPCTVLRMLPRVLRIPSLKRPGVLNMLPRTWKKVSKIGSGSRLGKQ